MSIKITEQNFDTEVLQSAMPVAVSYTHLRAHETRHDLVCRLLLEKKKIKKQLETYHSNT